jgi:23S rRNA (adenine2503-C2)-methyltransferase
MENLFNYSFEHLKAMLIDLNQKPYRTKQLFSWIYQRKIYDFDAMSDISKEFRQQLKQQFTLSLPSIKQQQASNDGTIKYLLTLEDQNVIETVLMRYNYGNVVCVTSQIGCNMGCGFCASGLLKKVRNLLTSEMVGQLLVVQNELDKQGQGQRVTHVVIMGIGEPFDNYDNVMDFIKICNHPHGLAIGARHITASTCGLPDKIRQYADESLQINLAISLHAPNNMIRSQLMRINNVYPIEQILDAVGYYIKKTKRRVTFEYILIKDVNDSVDHAKQLAQLIKGILAYVNLIPYNEVDEIDYHRSDDNRVQAFLKTLLNKGVTATVRKEFGSDIDAACGQLRAKHYDQKTR